MYWKEVRSEAWTRTKRGLASGYRFITSVAAPLMSAAVASLTLHLMKVTIPVTVVVGLASAIGTYLIFVFAEWCRHMLGIPVEWHAANLSRIEQGANKLAEIEGESEAQHLISAEFGQMDIGRRAQQPNYLRMTLHLVIRAGNISATLHDWRLRSRSNPKIETTLVMVQLTERGTRDVRIEAYGVVRGYLVFDFVGVVEDLKDPQAAWQLEFLAAGKWYIEQLPPGCY